MSLAAFFDKLQEHELELSQLDQHEEQKKKKKNISLKAKIEKYESSEDEDEKEETDDMSLFQVPYKDKGARTGQMKRFTKNNETSTSNQNFTCIECGKSGHMKMDCPNIKKGSFKGKNEMKNGQRAYIAREDNDTSSASEPESKEQAHLSLMASHHSDDEEFWKSRLSEKGVAWARNSGNLAQARKWSLEQDKPRQAVRFSLERENIA
ncbi:hypothetical protein Lal_00046725 [Lupinus albus]|nr:hypothetical protein Lal_00046725 [Lupinus albus]